MKRADFEFDLPAELIAQQPNERRSSSRLLQLHGADGSLCDSLFTDLPALLNPGDLLVLNDTRVVPARLFGAKPTGGRVELLLERATGERSALVHLRASKGLNVGGSVILPGGESATLIERADDLFHLRFSCEVMPLFETAGQIPLPPYIGRRAELSDRERYQTVFARARGAVAAPTAGLHFDASLFEALQRRGVERAFVTLHVGTGTFAPVRGRNVDDHKMHAERVSVSQQTCEAIEAARGRGGRVVAVGTTVVRSLESAAISGRLRALEGETQLFIKPGYRFTMVDMLITNFHLSGSTLLMLCAAFAGREHLLAAYAHAIRSRYRFFSYGDAMLLTPAKPIAPVPAESGR
jgi:S-adenosylmethionine:tRNA ribosyltransferase-isomerase